MSELQPLIQQLPERCHTCPTLLGLLAVAERYQQHSRNNSDQLAALDAVAPAEQTEVDNTLRQGHNYLVGISDQGAAQATRKIIALANARSTCRGPKRGSPEHFPVVAKVLDFAAGRLACRNPNLSQF